MSRGLRKKPTPARNTGDAKRSLAASDDQLGSSAQVTDPHSRPFTQQAIYINDNAYSLKTEGSSGRLGAIPITNYSFRSKICSIQQPRVNLASSTTNASKDS